MERRPNGPNANGEINGWKSILNNLALTYGDRLGLG
jgi:putative transposase